MLEASYVCSECGRSFALTPDLMVCPHCTEAQEPERPLRGVLDVTLEGRLEEPWDVYDLLPVDRSLFPPIPVGNTPLWQPRNLRARLGCRNLFIKDDSLNPTGSLKDRASFLVAAFAREQKIHDVVVASTGNAASSMAGVGAAAGLDVTIFVPNTAPRAKLVQSVQYGARVITVDGNYDRAYELSLEYTQRYGGLSRNTAYNPLTIEGKKTAAIEIFRQLGHAPEYVFVPAGDGVILSGIYKGFRDLMHLGVVSSVPTVYAVQADGSDAIARAYREAGFTGPVDAQTVADSIAVDVPRNGYHALRQLEAFDGRCVTVSDGAILDAQHLLASSTGLFAEPAASASLAGFLQTRDELPADATVVLLITGNGLKDIDAASRAISLPEVPVASLESLNGARPNHCPEEQENRP